MQVTQIPRTPLQVRVWPIRTSEITALTNHGFENMGQTRTRNDFDNNIKFCTVPTGTKKNNYSNFFETSKVILVSTLTVKRIWYYFREVLIHKLKFLSSWIEFIFWDNLCNFFSKNVRRGEVSRSSWYVNTTLDCVILLDFYYEGNFWYFCRDQYIKKRQIFMFLILKGYVKMV